MPQYFARTKLATKIAGIDPQKLNQAVSDGHYECAPPTTQGARRIFDENDLIALIEFGRALRLGISTREAGQLACGLRNFLHLNPDAELAVKVTPFIGLPEWHSFEGFDFRDRFIASCGQRRDRWRSEVIYLSFTREHIRHELGQAS